MKGYRSLTEFLKSATSLLNSSRCSSCAYLHTLEHASARYCAQRLAIAKLRIRRCVERDVPGPARVGRYGSAMSTPAGTDGNARTMRHATCNMAALPTACKRRCSRESGRCTHSIGNAMSPDASPAACASASSCGSLQYSPAWTFPVQTPAGQARYAYLEPRLRHGGP